MKGIINNFEKSKEDFGKKGNNLKILANLFKDEENVIIPETIVLSRSLYKKIILENGKTDFSKYENIDINPNITNDILNEIHNKFEKSKLVIRSSATCEDSIFFSGSGQYESFLNISEDEQIMTAIKKVYASLFGKNSKLYSKIYNINLNKESMAVLIQKVAPVVKSGVMFSCNPINGEKKYIIESTNGLGTNVVEGIGNINHLEISYLEKNNIKEENISNLIYCLDKIKEEFKCEIDVEWGIDKDNNIYIFQTRPIIFRNQKLNIEYDDKYTLKKCVPISKGFCIGKITNITNLEKGKILFQNEKYNFNDLETLLGAKGVILKENSKLSHFANILRELVKPCVFVENFDFDENKLYIIDAFNGNIIDFDSLSTNDKIKFMFDLFKYMKETYQNSFEKYNGILGIDDDNKFEQVVFDIDEDKILEKLKNNNFTKEVIKQTIYTYDLPNKELIEGNAIFRIQISNGKVKVQFKTIDTTKKDYRSEQGILIEFDSLIHAKDFMKSFNMIETGFQERNIIRYVSDNLIVNIIKWPNCKPYLGIETNELSNLEKIKNMLEIEDCLITSMGGKEIFQKLNLTLTNCKFEEE